MYCRLEDTGMTQKGKNLLTELQYGYMYLYVGY